MVLNISADTVEYSQNNLGLVTAHYSENWTVTATLNSDFAAFNGTVTLNALLTTTDDPTFSHTFNGTISYP
jgi:hypothetical protein